MSEPRLCPMTFNKEPGNLYTGEHVCVMGRCAWWIPGGTGRESVSINGTGAHFDPLHDRPGHCAILDIGDKR